VNAADLYLSVMSLGEIRFGIELKRKKGSTQSLILESWLETTVKRFGNRILPITPSIADHWGRQNLHQKLPDVDGLIAATAIVHDLAIVTRNTNDFIRCGAKLINPWNDLC
jgi:predicted nucleic acid-binding protein